jgi:hypothetical protein
MTGRSAVFDKSLQACRRNRRTWLRYEIAAWASADWNDGDLLSAQWIGFVTPHIPFRKISWSFLCGEDGHLALSPPTGMTSDDRIEASHWSVGPSQKLLLNRWRACDKTKFRTIQSNISAIAAAG